MKRTVTALIALSALLDAAAVQVNTGVQPARCGLDNGSAWANAIDGLPPYSYSWSNGATTDDISGLAPGDYTVTVTDGLSNTAQATVTVEAVWELASTWTETRYDCEGWCSGRAQVQGTSLMGTAPYTWPTDPNVLDMGTYADVFGLCGSQPTPFTVSDANGCAVTMQITVSWGGATYHNVLNVTPECAGENNGSILMDGGGWWMGGGAYNVSLAGGGFDSLYVTDGAPYLISGLPTGNIWVEPMVQDEWGNWTWPYCMFGPGEVIVPVIQPPCGSISGRVYNDSDQDCAQDNGLDIGLPYRVLTIEPGPNYAITAANGDYVTALEMGAYTIAQPLQNESQLCPDDVPAPFILDSGTPNVIINFADSSLVQHDLSVNMWQHQEARPGFYFGMRGHVINHSAYPGGPVTVTMTYDPVITPNSISPAPSSVVPGTVTWDIAQVVAYQHIDFHVRFSVPADITLLGTLLDFTFSESNTAVETDDLNNSATLQTTIVGAYDPNDKTARTSSNLSTTQYFLDEDQYIDYTIRFQNTGTAFAQNVVVRDSLELDLDPATLEIFGASHAFVPSFENARTLVFTFENINLPDSGFNEPNSHGSIHFRIRPRADIAVGDVISNAVGIYFDFNPPVITEPSVLIAEFSTGVGHASRNYDAQVSVYPNPTSDHVVVNVERADIAELVLCASDGRALLRQRGGGSSMGLDLGPLPSGIFTLHVHLVDGTARNLKLAKH